MDCTALYMLREVWGELGSWRRADFTMSRALTAELGVREAKTALGCLAVAAEAGLERTVDE